MRLAACAIALFGGTLSRFERRVLEGVCMREASVTLSSTGVEVHEVLLNFWVEAKTTKEEDVRARLYSLAL